MDRDYDPNNFVDPVNKDLALKDPRLCQVEEHYFCFNCVLQYLIHSKSCPKCEQHLTAETLIHPHFFC